VVFEEAGSGGKIVRQIIYGVLPLVISICSMAGVIWLLSSFVGFEMLLVVGVCFVAFASSVTLAEELVEWRRHREASSVQRQLLPLAS
jgi:ABC-type transport system involved in Fe-S cluster assembly fused permease/ATPase subunit